MSVESRSPCREKKKNREREKVHRNDFAGKKPRQHCCCYPQQQQYTAVHTHRDTNKREMAEQQAPLTASARAGAIEAAKAGDQHGLRRYLDEQGGDVNLRDLDTQGTLLHVSLGFESTAKYCCSIIESARFTFRICIIG